MPTQVRDTTVATQAVAASELSGQSSPMLQLPLRELGLKHVPAIPVDPRGMADTVSRLVIRINQREQALQGLSKMFTIGGSTARAYNFLYGSGAADKKAAAAREASHAFLARDPSEIVSGLVRQLKQPHDELALIAVGGGDDLTKLALDDPKQWSIGWTTFPDVYTLGLPHLEEWAASVDVAQPDKATAAFFPTIARYATTFNQILLRRVPSSDAGTWRALFGTAWTAALDAAAKAGLLYVIDLRIYETLQPQTVAGVPRFTPSTVTVLVQDPVTKAMTPELVRVAGGDNEPKVFSRQGSTTASAWVYALQAAKVSITVFGIWLGHVYQWHIVTAAMLMTMFAQPFGQPSGPQTARAAVELPHPVRQRVALELELGGAADFDRDRLAVPRADGSLRQRARVLRRRSDDHAGAVRPHRVGLHIPGTMGPISDRRPPVIHLERNRPLREHLRRSSLSNRSGRAAGPGTPELDCGIRQRGRRKRPWPARNGLEGFTQAGPPQSHLPHHGARHRPPLPHRRIPPSRSSPTSHPAYTMPPSPIRPPASIPRPCSGSSRGPAPSDRCSTSASPSGLPRPMCRSCRSGDRKPSSFSTTMRAIRP